MDVLVVDNDSMVGLVNSYYARKFFYVKDVKYVKSLVEAYALLEMERFDLLLLDVIFPVGHGLELLQWIRSRRIKMGVIIISEDNSPETVKRAAHLGAEDYLIKPFKFKRFEDSLNNVYVRSCSIQNNKKFNQESLDLIFRKQNVSTKILESEVLDKGLSSTTYKIVKKEIMDIRDDFTAGQLGNQLGIARVTIRRYLDFMKKQGILEIQMEYGKIGRPQHIYRLKTV